MEYIAIFFKGFLMGAANVIPGVSGGTIAFITGIYERLIEALKSCDAQALKHLLKVNIGAFWKHTDMSFIVALGSGMVAGVLILANVLEKAFTTEPVLVGAFFFGLILASIFSVGKLVNRWGSSEVILGLFGLALAVSLAFVNPAAESSNPFYLGLCGVAAMCSMIIPGISGSFILILMGNYKLIMLEAVNNLRELNLAESLPIIIPVGVGAVLGLILLSRFLSWLFKTYHNTAIALITGFVAGSLAMIWPWKEAVYSKSLPDKIISWNRSMPNFSNQETWIALLCLAGGITIIFAMEKLAVKK